MTMAQHPFPGDAVNGEPEAFVRCNLEFKEGTNGNSNKNYIRRLY